MAPSRLRSALYGFSGALLAVLIVLALYGIYTLIQDHATLQNVVRYLNEAQQKAAGK